MRDMAQGFASFDSQDEVNRWDNDGSDDMIGQDRCMGNSIRQTIQLKLCLPRLFFQGLQYDPCEAG